VRLGEAVERFVKRRRVRRRAEQARPPLQAARRRGPEGRARGHACPSSAAEAALGRAPPRLPALCDELVEEGLSGSRVRSVVNASGRCTGGRRTASSSPTTRRRWSGCPRWTRRRATGSRRRARRAGCSTRCRSRTRCPYALAVYATARRAEVLALRWRDVDLDAGLIELGADPEARKYDASQRSCRCSRRCDAAAPRADGGGEAARARRARRRRSRLPAAAVRSKSGRLAPGPLQERASRRGRRRSSSRSACTSCATRPRRGWTPPACRRRSPPC
jgi:hypothetical protein